MRLSISLLLAVVLAALAWPAAALGNHLHSMEVGNGQCVILAQDGNERFVVLPPASFQNTSEPKTTANPHPIHVNMHRGEPGQHKAIGVYGTSSDPCFESGDYIND